MKLGMPNQHYALSELRERAVTCVQLVSKRHFGVGM